MLTSNQVRQLGVMVEEISRWAFNNFGHNHSKWDATISLGCAGPAFGILEEVGEFFEAKQKDDKAEMEDSIADFLIFSVDYFSRGFGVPKAHAVLVEGLNKLDGSLSSEHGSTVLMSKFAHINLKSHQGIRGYVNPADTLRAVIPVWEELLALLVLNFGYHGGGDQFALGCLVKVWTKVQERDWKKDAEKGSTHYDPGIGKRP